MRKDGPAGPFFRTGCAELRQTVGPERQGGSLLRQQDYPRGINRCRCRATLRFPSIAARVSQLIEFAGNEGPGTACALRKPRPGPRAAPMLDAGHEIGGARDKKKPSGAQYEHHPSPVLPRLAPGFFLYGP